MTTNRPVREESLQTARSWIQRHLVVDGEGSGPPSEGFIDSLLAGGVNSINWTVAGHASTSKSALMSMLTQRWLVKRIPDKCTIARSVGDIERAAQEGKVAIIHGWQGAEALEDDYHWLEVFYDYGLRILQFCYNGENRLGYGCLEPHDMGLKRFGIDILQDCNRLGIVMDGSHTGERTTLDMIYKSEDPMIFSHSNPRSVHNNERNVSDTQIKECAAKGGVIGCPVFSAFVADTTNNRQPSVDEWVRCVDYVVDLVGIDHAGIGSDIYAHPGAAVWWDNNTGRRYRDICGEMTWETHEIQGMNSDYANFVLLIAALVQRGYEEQDVAKLIGSNFLRVFRQVWKS